MCLARYGDHPHDQGLQRLDQTAADAMVADFRSLRSRLRRFFGGLPVYIGHPDDEHFRHRPGHQDTRAYGWIRELAAHDDGLYAQIKWSRAGLELLDNAFFKFLSPRWVLQPLDDGAFRPAKLLSVGLTNQPNIPGAAIANETYPDSSDTVDAALHEALAQGRLTPAERSAWSARLQGDPAIANELAARPPILHVTPIAANLGDRHGLYESRQPFRDAVQHRMESTGEDYVSSWVRTRRDHPDLYAGLSDFS